MARSGHNADDRHYPTDSGDCRCGWEAHPQAFRWFPELGTPPLATLSVGDPPLSTAGTHCALSG